MSEILTNLREEQEYYRHDNWKFERIKYIADYIEYLENEISHHRNYFTQAEAHIKKLELLALDLKLYEKCTECDEIPCEIGDILFNNKQVLSEVGI